MSRLTWDGTTEPASRDQLLRRERGQGNVHSSCSADHEQDWQSFTDAMYFLSFVIPSSSLFVSLYERCTGLFYVCICMVTHIVRVRINRVRLPILLVVS